MSTDVASSTDSATDIDAMALALTAASKALAARINDGATLWCVAPGLDDHARHLAVEFVHPASVAARATPAVALATLPHHALVDRVRAAVRSGDVLVTLGEGDAAVISDLSARAPAWGVSHIHIGWLAADRFASGSSSVVPIASAAGHDRFLTRAYHLLWELTFLCLRAATQTSAATPKIGETNPESSCAVCADEASLAEVEAVVDRTRARVRTPCGPTMVDVSLIPPVRQHDLVLVHAGTALRVVSAPVSP